MVCQSGTTHIILAVDDDDMTLELVKFVLGKAGYLVRTALSGALALESIDEQFPDLVLLDALMPEMDGFDLLRRLKSDPRTQSVPVVMLSSLTDSEMRDKGIALGAIQFLTKPASRRDLLAAMESVLGR